jgi:hypothetical protein
MDEWMDEWMDCLIDWWMDGWNVGWMECWMDRWVCGWMDALLYNDIGLGVVLFSLYDSMTLKCFRVAGCVWKHAVLVPAVSGTRPARAEALSARN